MATFSSALTSHLACKYQYPVYVNFTRVWAIFQKRIWLYFSSTSTLVCPLRSSTCILHNTELEGQDKTRRSGVVKWNRRRSWYSVFSKVCKIIFLVRLRFAVSRRNQVTLWRSVTAQLRSVGEPRRFHSNPPNTLVARMLTRNCHAKGI
jgi:hypothetical protein